MFPQLLGEKAEKIWQFLLPPVVFVDSYLPQHVLTPLRSLCLIYLMRFLWGWCGYTAAQQTFSALSTEGSWFLPDAPSGFSLSELGRLFLQVPTGVSQQVQGSTLHVMGLLSLFSLSVKAQRSPHSLNWFATVSAFYCLAFKGQRCGTH